MKFITLLGSDLQNARIIIENHTNYLYQELEERAVKPATRDKAAIWNEKVLKIKSVTAEWKDYLKKSFTRKHTDWRSLQNKSNQIKQRLRTIHDTMSMILSKDIDRLTRSVDSIKDYETFINRISASSGNAILEELLYEVTSLENSLVLYCDSQFSDDSGIFDMTSILLGQSTTHLRTGESIVIEAGVGAYSSKAEAIITVAGKNVIVENGVGSYKMKVFGKPGKYTLPVKIDYTDQFQRHQIIQEKVEYTIDQ